MTTTRIEGRRDDDRITFDGRALVFASRMTPVIRLLALVFTIPFLALLPVYIREAPFSDWHTLSGPMLLITLFFRLLPLLLFCAGLYFTFWHPNKTIRLDPDSKTAKLTLWAPLRRVNRTYPLQDMKIAHVALEADYPAYDEPHVMLKFPDGRRLRMECFYDDDETRFWVGEITARISDASEAV